MFTYQGPNVNPTTAEQAVEEMEEEKEEEEEDEEELNKENIEQSPRPHQEQSHLSPRSPSVNQRGKLSPSPTVASGETNKSTGVKRMEEREGEGERPKSRHKAGWEHNG